MKNYLLSILSVIMLTVMSMEVNAQTQIKRFVSTPIDFQSNQTFSCSSLDLEVTSVNGNVIVVQDACGNTWTLTGGGNLPVGIRPGCILVINSVTPSNPNQPNGAATINITVRCN